MKSLNVKAKFKSVQSWVKRYYSESHVNRATFYMLKIAVFIGLKKFNNPYFLFALIIGYILLISSMPNFHEHYIERGFPDTKSYLAIAQADSLESLRGLSQLYPYQHLQRWPIHFLVGKYINLFVGNILCIYRTLVVMLLGLSAWLISNINTSYPNKLMYFAVIALNPYVFVEIMYAPPMLADGIFVVSMLALVIGLIEKKYYFLYLALILGIISRQTIIVIIPIMCFSSLFYPEIKKCLIKFFIISLILFFGYQLVNDFIFGTSQNGIYLSHITGLYYWLMDPDLPSLIPFIESIFALLLTLSPLLILNININYLPIALLGAGAIIAQPLLGGPLGTGANAARLMALSIPFIGIAFLRGGGNLTNSIICIILIMLNALHHHYAYIYEGYTKNNYAYLLAITASISIALKLFTKYRNSRNIT